MTSKDTCITCERHFFHEDTSNHAESVSYMWKPGNLEDYTSHRALKGNLLQALERYRVLIHPATTIKKNLRYAWLMRNFMLNRICMINEKHYAKQEPIAKHNCLKLKPTIKKIRHCAKCLMMQHHPFTTRILIFVDTNTIIGWHRQHSWHGNNPETICQATATRACEVTILHVYFPLL